MRYHTMYDKVKEFRIKMGLPIGDHPHILPAEQTSYFARFIMEELSEHLKACEEGSLVDAADALADLIYVTMGMAHAMGLPLDEIFNVVHDCNMSKVPANDYQRSIRGNQYDVVKPAGWYPPEPGIINILNAHKKATA
jgi:predicted HAD superfamily Cof-like phosphohydrolase